MVFTHFNAGDLPNGSSTGYAKLAPRSRSCVNRRGTRAPSVSNRRGSKRSSPSRRVYPPFIRTGRRAPKTSAPDPSVRYSSPRSTPITSIPRALEEASLATSSSESCTRRVPESGPWPLICPFARLPSMSRSKGLRSTVASSGRPLPSSGFVLVTLPSSNLPSSMFGREQLVRSTSGLAPIQACLAGLWRRGSPRGVARRCRCLSGRQRTGGARLQGGWAGP
jgi:hypothetical protein